MCGSVGLDFDRAAKGGSRKSRRDRAASNPRGQRWPFTKKNLCLSNLIMPKNDVNRDEKPSRGNYDSYSQDVL